MFLCIRFPVVFFFFLFFVLLLQNKTDFHLFSFIRSSYSFRFFSVFMVFVVVVLQCFVWTHSVHNAIEVRDHNAKQRRIEKKKKMRRIMVGFGMANRSFEMNLLSTRHRDHVYKYIAYYIQTWSKLISFNSAIRITGRQMSTYFRTIYYIVISWK